ncbi:hypothetical protein OC835_006393 [Tilletia horrida]|nr:hypothetical protein OC835_006393 [Tilletia horrida]
MNLLTARLLQLALLLLTLGADGPIAPGVQALPAQHSHANRRSLRTARPRIGIVVKNNDTAPHFGGSAFTINSRAIDESAENPDLDLNVTTSNGDTSLASHSRSVPGAFDTDPDATLFTLPLTKVGGVHLKTVKDYQPMDHFKRHLHAANQRLSAIRKRRVEVILAEKRGEADLPAGFGDTAVLLDPTLGLTPESSQVGQLPEQSNSSPPPLLHDGNGLTLGHGPAVLHRPESKRLLGGLIGSLGGDTTGSPSGFGSGSSSSAAPNATAGADGLLGKWGEPVSKVRASPAAPNSSDAGYPIKNLEVATSAAVTGAQPTTAEQSLGLDIEANDVGYIATIQIGSNHKPFRMLIDSGSADTWVASSSCTACGSKHQRLGTDTSSTFKPTSNKFSITYGTGSVSGYLAHDDVDIAGLKLANHTLGVALQQSRDFTDPSVPFDGLMGLARSELSNAGTPTPIDALFASGQVSAPVMGYRLGRVADGRNDGEVTFGGVDKLRFSGNLIEVDNISKQGFWEAAMGAVSFAGRDLGMQGRTAILDTGTTLIVAPKKDADAVHAAIPGSKSDGQGGYYIPCTTTESLALTFGGISFPIDPRDMLFLPVDQNNLQGDCISAISSGQVGQENEWLVGAVWLKNLYFATNSRTNTIGLGKLKGK